MCGTPTYLAPEVVNQREGGGYTNRVDSWSVGVMVFSMYDHSVILPFRLEKFMLLALG
jgi:serine/threonine/tyrosine protein kinase RAD53